MDKIEHEYLMAYGGIPKTRESLLDYVREKYPPNFKKLDELRQHVYELGWYRIQFAFDLIPTPTPRPRTGAQGHFYVKGAARNRKYMRRHIEQDIIYTRTIIMMRGYLPYPKTMSNLEKNLAEEGYTAPTQGADVDNIMKTYMDAIQGWLLVNDNIVTFSAMNKMWSLRPRLEIELLYQDGFDCPFNQKRMEQSKYYQQYEQSGELKKYHLDT